MADRRGSDPEGADYKPHRSSWRHASLFAQRNWLGALVLVLVVISAFASIKYAVKANNTANAQAAAVLDTRLTSFRACVENGNTLRIGLRADKNKEIRQARHPDPAVIEALDIPPADLARLTAKRIRQLQHTRDMNFALPDCLSVYPPLDGQTYPPALVKQAREQISVSPKG